MACGDVFDDNGHGTHVAGCAAGDVLVSGTTAAAKDTIQQYAGVAKSAQLVLTDVSVGGSFTPPDDTKNNLFPDPYNVGVRIFTIAWGYSSFRCEIGMLCLRRVDPVCRYTTTSSEFDSFMWTNKDFLILVAAGSDFSVGFRCSPCVVDTVVVLMSCRICRKPHWNLFELLHPCLTLRTPCFKKR